MNDPTNPFPEDWKDAAHTLINQFLPNHIWVGVDWDLFHIDESSYHYERTKFKNSNYAIVLDSFGYMSSINISGRKIQDVLFITLYDKSKVLKKQGLYEFLQKVGGNFEEYREQIVLITGKNPWNNML